MDWNKDGKEDWEDMAVYHDLIEHENSNDEKPPYSGGAYNSGSVIGVV